MEYLLIGTAILTGFIALSVYAYISGGRRLAIDKIYVPYARTLEQIYRLQIKPNWEEYQQEIERLERRAGKYRAILTRLRVRDYEFQEAFDAYRDRVARNALYPRDIPSNKEQT